MKLSTKAKRYWHGIPQQTRSVFVTLSLFAGILAFLAPSYLFQPVTVAEVGTMPVVEIKPSPSPVPSRPPYKQGDPIPSGCYEQQIKCIKAPCDPILVCSVAATPTPTEEPAIKTPPSRTKLPSVSTIIKCIREGGTYRTCSQKY